MDSKVFLERYKPFMTIYCSEFPTGKQIEWNSPVQEFIRVFHQERTRHDPSLKMEINLITHGMLSHTNTDFIPEMTRAILNLKELRKYRVVILLDWGAASGFPLTYLATIKRLDPIAEWAAPYLAALVNDSKGGVKYFDGIHGIGHSLGAHLVGLISKKSLPGMFKRITGLDPAGPWIPAGTPICLNVKDAAMIDVIHTSGKLGRSDKLGTVDFYPNWGRCQPGCWKLSIQSHRRVLELFLWSISNPGKLRTNQSFKVEELQILCPLGSGPHPKLRRELDYVEMGFHCIGEGVYYIETGDKEPWV